MILELNSDRMESVAGITVEYPYILHVVAMRDTPVPWHWHEEVEFVLVERGALSISTIERTVLLHAGEGAFINTNVVCSMTEAADTPDTRIQSHLMHPVFISGHYRSVFETKYVSPILQNKRLDVCKLSPACETQARMLALLKKAALLQREENSELQTRNVFSELWLLLLAEATRQGDAYTPVGEAEESRVRRMLSYIHIHYGEHITLADIAQSAAISKRECTRCFRRSIHRSPIEYLLAYRVEQAARLLRNTDAPVTEIALQTGFSGSAYFCKIFKAQRGVSPLAYRRAGVSGNDAL